MKSSLSGQEEKQNEGKKYKSPSHTRNCPNGKSLKKSPKDNANLFIFNLYWKSGPKEYERTQIGAKQYPVYLPANWPQIRESWVSLLVVASALLLEKASKLAE